MSTIVYPDHFLEDMPILSSIDNTTIICVASGPGYLSYQLAVPVLFDSPEFTGSPTAPTPDTLDNSTRLATTGFVQDLLAGFTGGGSPPGGAVGDLQYNDGAGGFAGGGVNWNGKTLLVDYTGFSPSYDVFFFRSSGSEVFSFAMQDPGIGVLTVGHSQATIETGNGHGPIIIITDTFSANAKTIQLNGDVSISGSLTGGAVGSQGDLQYNDGSNNFNAGGPNWDGFSVLTVPGSVNATSFVGDGSLLTGILSVIPGGSFGDLQFNDGSDGFAGGGPTWNGSTKFLAVPGTVTSLALGVGTTAPTMPADIRGGTNCLGLDVTNAVGSEFIKFTYSNQAGFYGRMTVDAYALVWQSQYNYTFIPGGVSGQGCTTFGYNAGVNPAPYQVGITPQVPIQKGLVVKGAPGQSANLQEWQNSSNVAMAGVSSTGLITAASFSTTGSITAATVNTTGPVTAASVVLPASVSQVAFQMGTFVMQQYDTNNCWISDNMYYDGTSWAYKANGYGCIFYFLNGGFQVQMTPQNFGGSGYRIAAPTTMFSVDKGGNGSIAGNFTVGGAITATGMTINGVANAVQYYGNGTTLTGVAPLASPVFTGVPSAPTAAPGTNNTQLATTAFVLANASPLPFSFSGALVTTPANDVAPWSYVPYAATVVLAVLTTAASPTGVFTVSVLRSKDGGVTFPDIVTTLSLSSGRLIQTSTIAIPNLNAGDLLRCDITAVSGTVTFSIRLTALTINH